MVGRTGLDPATHRPSLLTGEGPVTRPVCHGGLGFGYKWDMGWMHDTLRYLARDPIHRSHHHDELTFRSLYADDRSRSVISYLRRDPATGAAVPVVLNFTPVPRYGYRVEVPRSGYCRELINSDAREYGGSGVGNLGGVRATVDTDDQAGTVISLTLPPLGGLLLAGPGG